MRRSQHRSIEPVSRGTVEFGDEWENYISERYQTRLYIDEPRPENTNLSGDTKRYCVNDWPTGRYVSNMQHALLLASVNVIC